MGVLEEKRLIGDGLTCHTRVLNVSDMRRRMNTFENYKQPENILHGEYDLQDFFPNFVYYTINNNVLFDININYKIYSVLLLSF